MIDIIYILIIIIIIAIIVVWYISFNIREKSNNTELVLNTDDDKILKQWFEENKKPSFDLDFTNESIVIKLIKKLYNFDVNSDRIIIGSTAVKTLGLTNLEKEYYNITGNKIQTKFSEKEDCILYLRSVIGVNYEVCIINSSNKVFKKLSKLQNDIDLYFLNDIIESNLEKKAYDHLRKVINIRWDMILKTNNKNILERDSNDSFLFLKHNHNIPNLIGCHEPKGDRINLLCDNLEFEALIHRLNSVESLAKELE